MRKSTWLLIILVFILMVLVYEPQAADTAGADIIVQGDQDGDGAIGLLPETISPEINETSAPETNDTLVPETILPKVNETPLVVWYVVAKHLDSDFLTMAEEFRPDVVLMTVYSEDDIAPFPLTHPDFNLKGIVNDLHRFGIDVYYSYSLFSRSAVPREIYDQRRDEGTPYSEQDIHMADYARYLRETNMTVYNETYDIYIENGLDPEQIPHVLRKPVEGYFIPPGHYTSIDPLYQPYHEFMVAMIEQTMAIAEPDGLAFDHVRFFTFDDGYNQDCRDYILNSSGLDIYEYTPRPIHNIPEWSGDDALYYDTRAQLISYAVGDIISRSQFDGYEKFGTSIGMTDPARANGQYVELQGQLYDTILLMAYDADPNEIERNVRETVSASGVDVILGMAEFVGDDSVIIENINTGLDAGAAGIYLLGYTFSDEVHNHLLEIRGLQNGTLGTL
jgi:hypothetical protein